MAKKKKTHVILPQKTKRENHIGKIDKTQVRINAKNKLGRHVPEVQSGTGFHGSPKKDRKTMKQRDKKLFKKYLY